jgi:hypothetical protein
MEAAEKGLSGGSRAYAIVSWRVFGFVCEDEVQAMILADMGAQPFLAVGRHATVRTWSRKKISWRWDMLRKTNGLTSWQAWFSKLGED